MSKDNAASSKKNIGDWLNHWLLSFPRDSKIMVEIVSDDLIPVSGRILATAISFYILSPIDLIPDKLPIVGYIDDAIIIRIGLEAIMAVCPEERKSYYKEKYPDTFDLYDEQIEILKTFLGPLYDRLKLFTQKLVNRQYKGIDANEVPKSEELQERLFDDLMEYCANMKIDAKATGKMLSSGTLSDTLPLLEKGLTEEE